MMTECMRWLYDHYILPQIEGRPMDDGDAFRAALFWDALDQEQARDARTVLAFYAVQGFRLGLQFVPPGPPFTGDTPTPFRRSSGAQNTVPGLNSVRATGP